MAVPELPVATAAEPAAGSPDRRRKQWPRLLLFGPAALFVVLLVTFAVGLGRDPKLVLSPLIGKPVPDFALPPVKGRTLGLSSSNLQGEVSLVNVFASWCVACREEHPVFMQLAKGGTVPIHGLNYKDSSDDAARWLNTLGDPYTRTGADLNGRVGIDWGVYGLPETFVIAMDGRIAHKQIGPISPESWEGTTLPLIRRLQQQ